jgi:SpoVK/Ycf46/Vps4 family AAA+-type ATPase
MRLYELSQNYLQLMNMIEDMEDDALKDTLESIEDEIHSKAENIAKLMRNIDGDIDAIKTEEKRLADRRKALENRKNGLKQYVEDQLNLTGIDKVKTATFTIAIQNNPPSVHIDDHEHIPTTYWVAQEPKLDKKLLLQYLKDGNEINGVRLVQNRSLRIR